MTDIMTDPQATSLHLKIDVPPGAEIVVEDTNVFVNGAPVAELDDRDAANDVAAILRDARTRAEVIQGIRHLADFIETHQLPVWFAGAHIRLSGPNAADEIANLAATFDAEPVMPSGYDRDVTVKRDFGKHVYLTAKAVADDVCEPTIVDGKVTWTLKATR